MDKQTWILKTILDEVTDEINERASDNREETDALLAEWFERIGLMLNWVATGNIPETMRDDEFVTKFTQFESVPRKEIAQ